MSPNRNSTGRLGKINDSINVNRQKLWFLEEMDRAHRIRNVWGQHKVKGNSSALWGISCSDRFGHSCFWSRAHNGDANLIYNSFWSYPFFTNYCCCVIYSKSPQTSARPFFFMAWTPKYEDHLMREPLVTNSTTPRVRLSVETMLLC